MVWLLCVVLLSSVWLEIGVSGVLLESVVIFSVIVLLLVVMKWLLCSVLCMVVMFNV